jgi:hypothetical protein
VSETKPNDDLERKRAKAVAPYKRDLVAQLQRVRRLAQVVIQMPKGDGISKADSPGTDIMRAVIVLMHASLEDFLRTLTLRLLPSLSEEYLNGIALAGDHKRPDKIQLGALRKFRGKSVNDLIYDSIKEHLSRSNFNSTDDVARHLRSLGMDIDPVSSHFPSLQELMMRRHQIVHRSDRLNDQGDLRPIRASDVKHWIEALGGFVNAISDQAASRHVEDDFNSNRKS